MGIDLLGQFGAGLAQIAKHLGIGRASVYRALDGEVVPGGGGSPRLQPLSIR